VSEPIAFISHFLVKQGKRDDVKQLFQDVAKRLEADKPRTLVFLAYLNDIGTQVSFLHVFVDAEAMDIHFEGSDERARAAYEYVAPAGWEFYGRPSQQAMETMRQAATSAGVTLSVEPDFLGGFLRLGSS
jgi:quinol monooxygenase YgiN